MFGDVSGRRSRSAGFSRDCGTVSRISNPQRPRRTNGQPTGSRRCGRLETCVTSAYLWPCVIKSIHAGIYLGRGRWGAGERRSVLVFRDGGSPLRRDVSLGHSFGERFRFIHHRVFRDLNLARGKMAGAAVVSPTTLHDGNLRRLHNFLLL